MPTTDFYDPFGVSSGGDNPRFVKLVEPAFNVGTNQSTKLITTLSSGDSNSFIIAEFAQPIRDDARGERRLVDRPAAGPRALAKTESSRQSATKQGGPPHDHWAKLG